MPAPPKRPVTLRQVAAEAGVHVSSVSRALDANRRHLIGAEALQRIEAAASKLGFRPNHAAATLRRGRTMAVGVLMPDLNNQSMAHVMQGAETALVERGYFPLVVSLRAATSAQAVTERLLSQQIAGVIVATAPKDDIIVNSLIAAGIPAVLVNRSDPSGRLSAVMGDSMQAMAMAVGHLHALGHRRIALLAGPQSLYTGVNRLQGAQIALQSHQLQPWCVAACEAYSREAGRAGTLALIEAARQARGARRGMFTAICAANDLLALGAYDALREAGLAIPADVSVTGHNDILLVDMVNPPLTTLRGKQVTVGYEAARLLVHEIESRADPALPPPASQVIMFRHELIVRGSTAPAPATPAALPAKAHLRGA